MIFLMGFFSTFCGFIYNDFFSISLDYSNSCQGTPITSNAQCISYFGVDGAWGDAENKLAFMNSLKMKLSIIIGVT